MATFLIASILSVGSSVGYPALFGLVMAESAGIPVPGETSLILGGLLASQHKLQIGFVIAIAAAAAIIGDNIGYVIGRKGGRYLLERPGRFARQRQEVLDIGEPFFDRHGPKAVFFGRWILGLRTWASWLAGITRMHWRSFAFWNALGGVSWATTVGLLAYFAGRQVKTIFADFGIFALIALALALLGFFLLRRQHRRRRTARPRAQPPDDAAAAAEPPCDPAAAAEPRRDPGESQQRAASRR